MLNDMNELECLEERLELILKSIADTAFKLNQPDMDFYNETTTMANFLRDLADDLVNTNEEICDILNYYFDATGEYPRTNFYGK